MVKNKEAWHAAVHGVTKVRHDWATEQQQVSRRPGAMCSWSSSSQHLLSVGEGQVFYTCKTTQEMIWRKACSPAPPSKAPWDPAGLYTHLGTTMRRIWDGCKGLATQRYKESKSPCPALWNIFSYNNTVTQMKISNEQSELGRGIQGQDIMECFREIHNFPLFCSLCRSLENGSIRGLCLLC